MQSTRNEQQDGCTIRGRCCGGRTKTYRDGNVPALRLSILYSLVSKWERSNIYITALPCVFSHASSMNGTLVLISHEPLLHGSCCGTVTLELRGLRACNSVYLDTGLLVLQLVVKTGGGHAGVKHHILDLVDSKDLTHRKQSNERCSEGTNEVGKYSITCGDLGRAMSILALFNASHKV